MRSIFFVSFYLVVTLSAASAFAYIPETSYIFSQAAKHQGKSAYVITQDVVFKRNSDTVTVQEKWIVHDGFNAEVTVGSGPAGASNNTNAAVQYQATYEMNGRWMTTEKGREHTALPVDYAEGFFNARNVAQFYRLLQSGQILNAEEIAGPPKQMAPRATPRVSAKGNDKNAAKAPFKNEFSYVPNPNVRLTRAAGKPCWTFGLPSGDASFANKPPMLWIGQDLFTVQKVRTKGGGETQAGEYGKFTHGLDFPKSRHYIWGQNDVTAQVVRIDLATADQVRSGLSRAGSSRGGSDGGLKALSVKPGPLSDMIQEFYTRFR